MDHSHPTRLFILDILHPAEALQNDSLLRRMTDRDWDDLIRMAKIHRLGPIIHDGILRKSLVQSIPTRVLLVLQHANRKHTLRNLGLYRELMTATRLLDAADIPSLALKGTFLANFAYQALGLRPMRDIDLLIPKTHIIKAFALLKENGYRPCYEGQPEAYLDGNKIHLPPLARPNGIPIELHHRLTFPNPNGSTDEYESALWARSVSKQLGNTGIRFPCPEDMLLHLCYHATAGHQFSIGPLALLDLALLTRVQQLDWKQVLNHALNGWRQYLLAPLYLAKLHLGADIPGWFMDKLEAERDKDQWLESAEYLLFSEVSDHMLLNADMQKILCSKKTNERILAFGNIIFPPRATLATHFPIRPDSVLAFLYYPRHWQRLLNKKLPPLLSSLMKRPREIEKLSNHKRTFSQWLTAGTSDKPVQ